MASTHESVTGSASEPMRILTESRKYSMSSDRPSILSGNSHAGSGSLPPTVTPEPMFIAASAASQIVTNDHDSHSNTWFDQHGIEPSGETALVSPGALRLVNGFLDQLLYHFLSTARSTSLASLRPAVSEVLKPKLARDAIGGADQELHEYLGGGEDEELLAFHNGMEPSGEWDLELVWKRTRLRCMVYSSLGDLEEEDEDMYTEEEQLDGPPGHNNRFSNNPGVVSPAVAIFLTSILEFMGEQALVIAGQAAYNRLQLKYDREDRDGSAISVDIADRVVVEEIDMEKVAMGRTLGRLWRGWKKQMRSPTESILMARSFSRDSILSRDQSRRNSNVGHETPILEGKKENMEDDLAPELTVDEYAATVPLPEHANDIREIETPWLRIHPEDSDLEPLQPASNSLPDSRRPLSLVIFSNMERGLPTPERSQTSSPAFLSPMSRKRSLSMPSPVASLFSKKQRSVDQDDKILDINQQQPESISEPAATNMSETDEQFHRTDDEKEPAIEPFQTAQDVYANRVDDESEHDEGHERGTIAGIVAGATAIGAVAVAGIVAAAKGEAPQTNPEDTDGGEDLAEEAEILTSSRVSIGEKSSPDRPVAPSRHSSVRASSVHSLRLVDVTSTTRSRNGSMDATDYLSGKSLGHRNGVVPIATDVNRVSSPIQRASTASPTMRNATASPITLVRSGSAMSVRGLRHAPGDAISEVDESAEPAHEDSSSDEKTPIQLALPDRSPLRTSGSFPQRFSSHSSRALNLNDSTSLDSVASTVVEPGRRLEPTFTLAAAPTPRGSREVTPVPTPVEPTTSSQTNGFNVHQAPIMASSHNLRAPGHDSGVPPLTPLREMMEGAADTSDEASSIAPSLDDAAASASNYSPKSSHNVSFDSTRSVPRVVNGGGLARYSPTQTLRDDDITPKPEEHGKFSRALHTSESGSSIGSNNKLRAVRTSEESAKDGKGRSFEELIQSDQTIQYTLTPQTMREIESQPNTPTVATVVTRLPASPPANSTTFSNDTSRPRTSSSVNRFTGLHSNPPPDAAKKATSVLPISQSAPSKLSDQLGPSASVTPPKQRMGGSQARDPRVAQVPIDDFADFIRSTGPDEGVPPKADAQLNGGQRGIGGTQRTVSAARSRISAPASAIARAPSSTNRARLQAREAIVPYGGSSSELIDFIRQGPPSSNRDVHRIPRTVAPFRTTMDSDQMSGAVSANQDTSYSQASTIASIQPSMISSTSQSALLSANQNTAVIKHTQQQNKDTFERNDMDLMPKRKTRRVKDPYAIDFSDEEDELDFAPQPKKPVRAEESLIDFLNNAPPPPPQPTTAFNINQKAADRAAISTKKSSRSLASRFSRKDSLSGNTARPASSTYSIRSSASRTNVVAPRIAPTHTPIAAKYTTSNNSPNSYGGSASQRNQSLTSSLVAERAGGAGSNGRVQQKSYLPREAIVESRKQRTATDDLAEFLKSTPPPPTKTPEPLLLSKNRIPGSSGGNSSSGGGFSSMFSRKKKMAAA